MNTNPAVESDAHKSPSKLHIKLAYDTGAYQDDFISQCGVFFVDNLTSKKNIIMYQWVLTSETSTPWQSVIQGIILPPPGDGTWTLNVIEIGKRNGKVFASSSSSVVIDTNANAPTISLMHDSGYSDVDLITNEATLNISGVENGAKILISVDEGLNWIDESSYNEYVSTVVEADLKVHVKQIDVAGNESSASTLSFRLDKVVPNLYDLNEIAYSGRSNAIGIELNVGDIVVSYDTTSPYGSSVSYADETFTYDASNGFIGEDSFSFIVSDVAGNKSVSTINIEVNNTEVYSWSGFASIDEIKGGVVSDLNWVPGYGALISGYMYNQSMGDTDFFVARIASDGSLDKSFGTDGFTTIDISNSFDWDNNIAVCEDGSILVAGMIQNDRTSIGITKLTAHGSLDKTFGDNGTVVTSLGESSGAADIELLSDGSFVVGGWVDGDFAVVKYNTDGSVFESFGNSGTAIFGSNRAENIFALMPTVDGKIIICGVAYTERMETYVRIVESHITVSRLNVDGSLDTSFGDNGYAAGLPESGYQGTALALRDDGSILVGGNGLLACVDSNGNLVSDFGNEGVVKHNWNWFSEIEVQDDNRIVIAGGDVIARFNADGSNDNSFGNDGAIFTANQSSFIDLDSGGNIILAGNYYSNMMTPNNPFMTQIQLIGIDQQMMSLSSIYPDWY